MSTDSYLMAQDPVDPKALFDAARAVAGNHGEWSRHQCPGGVDLYYADGPAEEPLVSVHFPAAGGRYPADPDTEPDGYVLAHFCGGGELGPGGTRQLHERLARQLGRWLAGHGCARWTWSFGAGPWMAGGGAADSR
jgi:hypothetical protein